MSVAIVLLLLGSCSALRMQVDEATDTACAESMSHLKLESGCVGGASAASDKTHDPLKCQACVVKALEDKPFALEISSSCMEKYASWCDRPVEHEEMFVWHDWTGQAAYCYEYYGNKNNVVKHDTFGKFNKALASNLEYAKNCASEDVGLMGFLKMQKEFEYVSNTSKFVAAGGECKQYGYSEKVTDRDPYSEMNVFIFQKPGTSGVPRRFLQEWVNHECNQLPSMEESCHPSWSKHPSVMAGFPCAHNSFAPEVVNAFAGNADDEKIEKPDEKKWVMFDHSQGWCFETPTKEYMEKCVLDFWQANLTELRNESLYYHWDARKMYASPPHPPCSQTSYKTDSFQSGAYHINLGPQPWAPEVTMYVTPFGLEHFYEVRQGDPPDLDPVARPSDATPFAQAIRGIGKVKWEYIKSKLESKEAENLKKAMALHKQKCPYSAQRQQLTQELEEAKELEEGAGSAKAHRSGKASTSSKHHQHTKHKKQQK